MKITDAQDKAAQLAKQNRRRYFVVEWMGFGLEVASEICMETWAAGSHVLEVIGPDGNPA